MTPSPPVQLDGAVDDSLRGFGREELGHRDLRPRRVPVILEPCGAEHEQARRVELRGHVREGRLRELLIRESLPELDARPHTGSGVVEGASRHADGRRAVIVSCLDNLLKGAAGQAVQNLNVMLGWGEAEGLE